MAVDFNVLFARLTELFEMSATITTHQIALRTKFDAVVDAYAASSAGGDLDMIAGLVSQIENRINDGKILRQVLQADARRTVIEMMDDALVAVTGGAGLPEKTPRHAIKELIRQMVDNSKDIDGTTITIASTTAVSGNQGNGTFLVSALASQIKAPTVADNPSVKTELVRARCIGDSNGKYPPSSERFLIEGQRKIDYMDEDWPKGSGIKYGLNAVNPTFDQGTGPGQNVVRDGVFADFTSNNPDHWDIITGSAGSTIKQSPTTGYRETSSYALRFDNDGSTTLKVRQTLNSNASNSSLGKLKPDTVYSLSFVVKKAGTVSGGNLKVRVEDSGGTALNNSDANRKMEISLAHNDASITTSYVLVSKAVQTPRTLPSKDIRIVIETDTAFTNGSDIYIDDVCLAEMHKPSPGGLACQVIPGSTDFAVEDGFTIQVTNNGEGKFAKDFDQFFPMEDFGFSLPAIYDGSETQADY